MLNNQMVKILIPQWSVSRRITHLAVMKKTVLTVVLGILPIPKRRSSSQANRLVGMVEKQQIYGCVWK